MLQSNFIEITLRHGCSPANLLHIFRAPFSNNTSGRLLMISIVVGVLTDKDPLIFFENLIHTEVPCERFLALHNGSFFLSFGPIYFHVLKTTYEMHCTIWYHLYKLKSENLHGRVLLLVKLQAKSTYLKSTTPLWMFFAFFKLYKWYQITQRITYYQCCRSFGLALIACFSYCQQ